MTTWRRPKRAEDIRKLKDVEREVARAQRRALESEKRLTEVQSQRGQVHTVSRAISGYIERNGIADALRAAIGGEHG
jgi:hypothetical protein